jgi:putative phosphoesterase
MTRIGAISDSHSDICDWAAVFTRVRDAFDGVDMILHCGDVGTVEALDDLETIAPVRSTRSAIDTAPDGVRVFDGPTVVDVAGHRVVLAFQRPEPSVAADAGAGVVVFGGTHAPSIETIDGVLWVNPGSPALAERTSVAVVTVGGTVRADIVDV